MRPTVFLFLKTKRLMRHLPLQLGLAATLLFTSCTMKADNFDSDTWKAQRGVPALENQRGRLVVALDAVIPSGTPRAEVIRVLGEPDQVDSAAGIDVYELGTAAYGIDEEYIEVHYKDGNVVSHRLMRR